jgi:BASS family bile acid:Na+ symporter
MKLLILATVWSLMISIAMSLNWTQFVATWRRLTPAIWGKLLLATFIIPPIIAIALQKLLPIDAGAFIGLYLVAVAPGAPLMTHRVAQRGFDMQMAASYQVWGAILTPVMVPLLVGFAGWLYGRVVWIPPRQALWVIAKQQFVPLVIGVLLMSYAPTFSIKLRRGLNVVGNTLLMIALIALLLQMGPALKAVSPWVAIAALILAAGCIAASALLLSNRTTATQTLVISNANRHVGLALLIAGFHFGHQPALPAIVAYAFAAQIVMWLYSKLTLHGIEAKMSN